MKRFGRTEGPPDNLWWVIYEAPTEGDFAGGDKVAAFKRHADAKEFLNATYETSHASRVHADEAVLRLEADLEAVMENLKTFGWHHHCCRLVAPGSYQGCDEKYCDCGWNAVRAAWEGK